MNNVVVVTGGSRGIGFAIAKRLSECLGFPIAILGRNKDNLTEAAQQLGDNCFPIQCDISKMEEVDAAYKNIKENIGAPTILVNNAGMVKDGPFVRANPNTVQETFNTNVFSAFRFSSLCSRDMIRKKEGCIINIGSVVGIHGNPGQVVYSSSKAALTGFTKSLSKELGPYNIRVNLIAPGFIDETGMTQEFPEAKRKEIISNTALKKLGKPEDIADCVEFLINCKYVTGQVIEIDGGLMI